MFLEYFKEFFNIILNVSIYHNKVYEVEKILTKF